MELFSFIINVKISLKKKKQKPLDTRRIIILTLPIATKLFDLRTFAFDLLQK